MTPAAVGFQPELGRSYVVEASAGTGKTRELVNRIVDVLATGAPIEGIVAVTFTDAAAGHMKLRVRERLDQAIRSTADDTTRDYLVIALQRLDRAFIGTIHAFCAQLLHQRPVEAAIDPAFEELDQASAEALFNSVFRTWLGKSLAQSSPVLRRVFERLSSGDSQTRRDPVDRLCETAWRLIEWRDHPRGWERQPFDRREELTQLLKKIADFVELRSKAEKPHYDPLFRELQPVADFLERVERADALGSRDDDRVEAELIRLPYDLRWLKSSRGKFAEGITREAVLAAWDELRQAIEAYRLRSDADLAVALRDELWELNDLYAGAKRRAGKLDFADLLIHTRDLLANGTVRKHFQQRFTHVFVDEFQDTDPLQAEILLLLTCSDPEERNWRQATPCAGKLFLVGDPKQSIYRFRRADVDLYRGICRNLAEGGAGTYTLQTSQRSVQTIQSFVNSSFESLLPDYLPLLGGAASPSTQPGVIALPMPTPYSDKADKIAKKAINACSPAAVAAFIEWLVTKSGWTVRDPSDANGRRVIRAEDVCILFRRFTNYGEDLTRAYVRSLEARGIRHVLVGSKSFHKREEIGTIRAALRAIEWPDDELSVFALLHGSLFSIPDGTLLKFHSRYGRLFPFEKLPGDLDEEFHAIRDAFRLVQALHRQRNHQPAADTINVLLEHVRAHAGFAFRKGGERVLANVYRLADLARAFEARNALSFRSFVEHLDKEYDSSEAAEATVLEQSADGVKLMTVHKAKGLEFPVVILADLTANLVSPEGPDRFVDSERGLCAQKLMGCAPWELLENLEAERRADEVEGWRLAYVAATRARDILVVAAIGEEEPKDSWLGPLYPALYPRQEEYRNAGNGPGCPPFRDRTVLNRPTALGPREVSIQPDLHTGREGGNEVVWFDPALLNLEIDDTQGIDHEAVLKGTPEQRIAGRERYRAWSEERSRRNSEAATPRHSVLPVTATASEADRRRIEPETISIATGPLPATRSFGKLVHAILQHAGPGASVEELLSIARLQSRLPGHQTPDLERAAQVAHSALRHPVVCAAATAERSHREYPVLIRLFNGSLAEGKIDLAYFQNGVWTVVDFKTGSADQARYQHQLSLYASALAEATGEPVKAYLLAI